MPGMKLTQQQEKMISAFLQQSGQIVAGLPPNARQMTMNQVKSRLRNDLAQLGNRAPSDQEVVDILKRCRVSPTGWQPPAAAPRKSQQSGAQSPRVAAAPKPGQVVAKSAVAPKAPLTRTAPVAKPPPQVAVRKRETPPVEAQAPEQDERVWLGVCEWLARHRGFDVGGLRAGFFILGLFTGPFALVLYLYLYFEKYLKSRSLSRPAINRPELTRAVGNIAMVAVGIYITAFAILRIGEQLYLRFMANDLALGSWGWLGSYQHLLFFWTVFCLLPLTLLAELPLAHGWDQTIKKVVRAGLTLYAVTICLGLAAAIAGTILVIARDFVG